MKSLSLSNAKLLYNDKAIDGLHGIDLKIEQGEVLGLMGPSGCGKSTLAKVVANKIKLTSGGLAHNFENIFYLEESLLVDNKSVLENFVEYAHGDTQNQKVTRARMACSDLEITNYINSQVRDLSTGQRQRVLLGLALVAKSDLIILDEPFSHLEAPLKRELIEILLPLFREIDSTLLWISHDQQMILQYSQRVALMNYGKIIQCDEPQKLYFYPESMFALDFFGQANKEFLIDQRSSFWNIDLSQLIKNQNVMKDKNPMLVYRAQAIRINQVSQVEVSKKSKLAKKVSSIFDGQSYLHTFTDGNSSIVARSLTQLDESLVEANLELDMSLINIIN